jgi:nitrite reductase (NADH) small subunit
MTTTTTTTTAATHTVPGATATIATMAPPATPCATVEVRTAAGWVPVCGTDALETGRGVAVLLPGGEQAALFRDRSGRVWAVGNIDPFTGAGVLSHGLTGSADGRPYVASPLLKQRFDLADGRCLDDDEASVPVYQVRLV